MKFWDTSALLPLIMEESASRMTSEIWKTDPNQTVWCLTEVEIAAALARRAREGLSLDQQAASRARWNRLSTTWTEVISWSLARLRALRLVNLHALRAADSLQLAAAILASDERPDTLPFVCLDERLREAARKEGFPVLPS